MVNTLMRKAELTRAQIVESAVEMARHAGLESLTIGAVAERAGLSKSGVFSRVGSRESLTEFYGGTVPSTGRVVLIGTHLEAQELMAGLQRCQIRESQVHVPVL